MKTRTTMFLIIATGLLIALLVAYKFGGFTSISFMEATQRGSASARIAAISSSPFSRGTSAQNTNSGAPWRPMRLSKAELASHPKFWMLAYSEEDKAWLERFGYPTIAQESQLEKSSVDTLRALADGGDLHARVHLGLRWADIAMKGGDPKLFTEAKLEISQVLVEGGPYEAAKVATFFASLPKQSATIGELSELQLRGLQNDLLPYYEIARGISEAYGDSAAVRAFNQQDIGRYFGLPPEQNLSFQSSMKRLSNINKTRMQRGLSPMLFEQRPVLPTGSVGILEFQASNAVFER